MGLARSAEHSSVTVSTESPLLEDVALRSGDEGAWSEQPPGRPTDRLSALQSRQVAEVVAVSRDFVSSSNAMRSRRRPGVLVAHSNHR